MPFYTTNQNPKRSTCSLPGQEHFDTYEAIKIVPVTDESTEPSAEFNDDISDAMLLDAVNICVKTNNLENWFDDQMNQVAANCTISDDNVPSFGITDQINNAGNGCSAPGTPDILLLPDQDISGLTDILNTTLETCEEDVSHLSESHNLSRKTKSTTDFNTNEAANDKENTAVETTDDAYRKRKKNKYASPSTWKKHQRKLLRNSGKEYVGVTGKTVTARTLGQACKDCRYECTKQISEEERLEIFSNFWEAGSKSKQASFIVSMIDEEVPSTIRRNATSERGVVRYFHLQVGIKKIRVCKWFFESTLNISSTSITTALKNSKLGIPQADRRGKHVPSTKIPEEDCEFVCEHIASFPKMKPHYNRHDSTRDYLDHSLNIKTMHSLYKAHCDQFNKIPVKEHIYRRLFNTRFNLVFHKPRKDSCLTCDKFKLGSVSEEQYQTHMNRKESARQEKDNDKKKAKEDASVHVCTFDLEQVLSTPNSSTSTIFYKRKLNVYNLSAYSLGTGSGLCVLWNETEGKRGSNEIGTSIFTYLQSLPPIIKHVTLYSDNCGGQNKNRYFSTALMFALQESRHFETIEHKFLESGHTDMEVDSVHAAVEHAKRHVPVYIPSDWETVCRFARKRNPYNIIALSHEQFLNFKEMSKSATHLSQVNWKHACWIKYMKAAKEDGSLEILVMYKESFDGAFTLLTLKKTRKAAVSSTSLLPCKLYTSQLGISASKKADLLALCKDGTIPSIYHSFYENLPLSGETDDRIPVPDDQESSDDEE